MRDYEKRTGLKLASNSARNKHDAARLGLPAQWFTQSLLTSYTRYIETKIKITEDLGSNINQKRQMEV